MSDVSLPIVHRHTLAQVVSVPVLVILGLVLVTAGTRAAGVTAAYVGIIAVVLLQRLSERLFVDEQGLTVRVFRNTHIPWSEVTALEPRPTGLVKGMTVRTATREVASPLPNGGRGQPASPEQLAVLERLRAVHSA